MSSPAKERASDKRKIHIPILPGVAEPYCSSGGQTTAAWPAWPCEPAVAPLLVMAGTPGEEAFSTCVNTKAIPGMQPEVRWSSLGCGKEIPRTRQGTPCGDEGDPGARQRAKMTLCCSQGRRQLVDAANEFPRGHCESNRIPRSR